MGTFMGPSGGGGLACNQTMAMRSRLVGLYMLFYAVGSGLGAIGSTLAYARSGWAGVYALGALVSLLALVFWWLTRRVTDVALSPIAPAG
ncbi:hypothetical protein [Kerstersia gyiorum]|nr:putative MFS family arabinose efflux permease [Kerstersia gyiorum]MCP1710192.1 putative MFS family arabinose efflux permease [Kerstersia gyiorum]